MTKRREVTEVGPFSLRDLQILVAMHCVVSALMSDDATADDAQTNINAFVSMFERGAYTSTEFNALGHALYAALPPDAQIERVFGNGPGAPPSRFVQ